MKDAAFLKQLRQELPRRSLSPKATQRFEDAYRMLGVQKEAPIRKRRHKGLWVTATAACLCCGMLFGVNAAFPAFAESLPGVGRFFEAFNGNFTAARSSKTAHGANLDSYQPQAVDVTATGGDGSSQMEVKEAYSDGEMVSFTVDLTLPQAEGENFTYVGPQEDGVITLNGEACPIAKDTVFYGASSDGETNFSGVFTLPLSQPLADGETVDVEVSFPTLYGFPRTTNYETKGEIIDIPGVNFYASFTVDVDTSHNVTAQLDSPTDNGAQVQAITSTPTGTEITVSLPDWKNSDPRLYTMDGMEVKFNLTESIDKGGFDAWFDSGEQTCTLYYDGVPAGTEQTVLRFYSDGEQDSVLAEFTIDLAAQTAVPSTTYDDGGALDLDGPFHYNSLHWFGGENAFNAESGQMELSGLAFYRSKNWFLINVETPDEYREVEASIYTADGTLLGTTVSTKDVPDGRGNGFLDEDVYYWNYRENPVRCYDLYISSENYLPAWNEEFTVVVTDTAKGEELIHQTVQLTERTIQ